jgi:integrase
MNMRKYDAEKFSKSATQGPSSRSQINSTLSKLGNWLNEIERAVTYNPFKGVKMPKSRVKVKPPVYSCKDLGLIFNAISRITGAPEGMTAGAVKQQYNMFARFVLQTGLRYSHAFEFTCGDFTCESTVIDPLFGEEFCKISAYEAVEAHKEAIEEEITKKLPPSYIYIHSDLYSDIVDWCERRGLEPGDRIMRMSIGALREQGRRIKERSGLRNFTWSVRHTWASVMYQMVGDTGLAALVEMGGWRSEAMPLQHYISQISPEEAYRIVKEYHIYLPASQASRYIEIQQRVQELDAPTERETLDEMALLRKQIAELQAEQKKISQSIKR